MPAVPIRGCPTNNLAQEMSPVDEGFRTRVARIFASWHDAVASALRRGQHMGLVRASVDPEESAMFLIATYEGFTSLAKSAQDPAVFQSGIRMMTGWIDSLRERGGES